MFLRAYRRDDKRALQAVFYESVHGIESPHFTPTQLAHWARTVGERERWNFLDEQWTFVVEANKKNVGFASMSKDGELRWIYVHPAHQYKGVATALMRQMERVARKHQLKSIQARVSLNAQGFFERMGFKVSPETAEPEPDQLFTCLKMKKNVVSRPQQG